MAQGDSVKLVARAFTASNSVIGAVLPQWIVGSKLRIWVSPTGWLHGKSPGSTTVRAVYGGRGVTVPVTVVAR